MVKAPQGLRHRTRKIFSKSVRERGAVPPLSRILINYMPGDRVYIVADPAIHKAMPHRRYHGKVGTVVGKRGRAYIVQLKVGSKIKTLFLLPEHMRPAFSIEERVKNIVEKLKQILQTAKQHRKMMLETLQKLQPTIQR
ncbi:MAG TPA: 50S ribosomal protein L21e [Ignisphaera aggregans]|uniref:Large ribosomal subunit protein eL21 n=1 Tax=Ignisphaera aggregans TaxID=334771 RepID=A0A832YYL0_9CREN|nr:50S ribosomal protein L21e [Ignisphaera aggregans]